MELRHLRYFVAVAEELHITRASERLGIQQPPLSQQIRALESELGVALFLRVPRGVVLTAAGEVFLEEARTVLEGAARGALRARLAARGQRGRLVVGITTSATLHPVVPRILGEYSRQHPAVALDVREANAADLTEALGRGDLHAAFLRAVVARPTGIAFAELLREPLLVVLPEGHRLAPAGRCRKAVGLGDLAAERFILVRRPAAPGIYAGVLSACRDAGFEPDVAAEVGRMLTAINLVAAGVGISLVPGSMRSIRLGGVCYVPLRAPAGLDAPLTLAHRAGDDRAVVTDLIALTGQVAAEAQAAKR